MEELNRAIFQVINKDKQLVLQTKKFEYLKEVLNEEDLKEAISLFDRLSLRDEPIILIGEINTKSKEKVLVEVFPFDVLKRNVNNAIEEINYKRTSGRKITSLELPPIDEIESVYFFEKNGFYYFRIHYKNITKNLFTLKQNENNMEVINSLKKLWIYLREYICRQEIRKNEK
jgi:hypothetical protein